MEHENLFEPPTGRWALIGAAIGLVSVGLGFVALAVLQDLDRTVIGAAALAGPFGGAGFGAMVGGVLGGIKAAAEEAAGETKTGTSH
ncbi:MAG: hypothetical protein ACLGIZ_05135 [Acidimicrobiia bacterium]|jgi:hypothetical protein